MLTYLIGSLVWGGAVLALGVLAVVAERRVTGAGPSLAEVLAALGMAVVHGLAWPLSVPITIASLWWRR